MRKAAQVLVDVLLESGVDTIFGYPGGAVLPFYDALYDSRIRHILVRHEQGAAHAADAYARVTGKVGVCVATSGPGATNLVTGLTNAYMDSIPVVAITGQVPVENIGRDAFQEADITGITLPITKYSYLVKDSSQVPRVIREALYIARTGRPGPVVVDIPRDVFNGPCPEDGHKTVPRIRGYRPYPRFSPQAVEEVATLIARAERPLLFVGGGAVNAEAAEEIRTLVERTQIPVISTLMGLGVFPGNHPLFLGMVGMHGTFAANRATAYADLILALGVRFDDRVTGALHKFAPRAKVVHVDVDAAELGKNVLPYLGIAGDLKAVLQVLLRWVKPRRCDAWRAEIEEWRSRHPAPYPRLRPDGELEVPVRVRQKPEGPIDPHWLVWEVYRITRGESIVVTDVGQHQMWTALCYPFIRPRQLVTSGGLGTMGFGLPAAIGAQIGRPDQEVWLISGDGSFLMTNQELATAVAYQVPIRVVIVNNGYLGMVRQWQELFYQRRYSQVDISGTPDFSLLARAYGAAGMRAETLPELREALEEARHTPGPVVIDARVEREADVFPMIPSGMSVDDIIVEHPSAAVSR